MPVEHAKGRRSHHAALILTGCWSDPDVTGPTNSCATYLYPPIQSENACIKCDSWQHNDLHDLLYPQGSALRDLRFRSSAGVGVALHDCLNADCSQHWSFRCKTFPDLAWPLPLSHS